ncbi:MAG: hypothetical protein JXR83_12190 [Deltaproteobacteria bacterium]|nr:hypothetical protein [Deltaproteobacteria bacterium]
MNRAVVIAALLLSASALAVALLRPALFGTSALESERRADDQASPRGAAVGYDADDAESRMAALERTVASLARRMTALESGRPAQAGAGTRPGAAAADDALAALRSDVDALLTGSAIDTEAGQKRFQQLVRVAQDELFAERMQEHEAERARERADRITRLAEEANLSAQQTQDLTRLLDDERDQRRALRDNVRAGDRPRAEVFAEFQAIEQKTDEGARKLLDDDQYTRYQAMRQEERPRGPWGGPRGSGGGPFGRGRGQR